MRLKKAGDGFIVRCGEPERLEGKAPAQGKRRRAPVSTHLQKDLGVLVRRRDHGDVSVVLGPATDHRRPADVDLLHRLFTADARTSDGGCKRIKVHGHEIYGAQMVLFHGLEVLRVIAAVENPGMDAGMERFDSAIEHFGKAGEGLDLDDRKADIAEDLRGPAGGDNLNAEGREAGREFHEASLIGDAQKRAADGRIRHFFGSSWTEIVLFVDKKTIAPPTFPEDGRRFPSNTVSTSCVPFGEVLVPELVVRLSRLVQTPYCPSRDSPR